MRQHSYRPALLSQRALLLFTATVFCGCVSDDDDFVAPDRAGPTFESLVQNRDLDSTGQTLSITFNEEVTAATAEDVLNYAVSGGINVTAATLRAAGDVVDLTLDGPIVPGVNFVSVAAGIEDTSGNASSALTGAIITSTDTVDPSAVSVAGTTISGPINDTITVMFDDDMIESEAETVANWTVESPVGTPFDITGTVIDYVPGTRTATATLTAGDMNLLTGDDVSVSFTTMRDIGGNTITATTIGTTAISATVSGDNNPPVLLTAAAGTGSLVLTFSEAVSEVETADLQGAGNPNGTELILTDASDPGAAAVGTIELTGTPVDGNALTISDGAVAQSFEFDFASGSVSLSGLPNDTDSITISDSAGPTVFEFESSGGISGDIAVPIGSDVAATVVALVNAINGTALAVTARAVGANTLSVRSDVVGAAANRPITGSDSAGVQTLVDMTGGGITGDSAVAVDHDAVAGTVANLQAAIQANSFNVGASAGPTNTELALTNGAAGTVGNVPINVTSGSIFSVSGMEDGIDAGTLLLEPTTSTQGSSGLRATVTYAEAPDVADSLRIYGVTDLAGNQMAPELGFSLVASDSTAPSIDMASSAAMTISGTGNDTLTLVFEDPIHPDGLSNPANYTLEDSAGTIDITEIRLLPSGTDSVVLSLGEAVNLQTTESYTVTADELRSRQGVPTAGPISSGALTASGDATAPTLAAGDVRLDPTDAMAVLVEFSETVLPEAQIAANYSIAGNTTDTVSLVHPRVVRVVFQTAPAPAETLDIAAPALTDQAGNVAGAPAAIDIVAADSAAPTVTGIIGSANATAEHSIDVAFSEPVVESEARDLTNYAILTVGTGVAVDLSSASVAFDSAVNTVRISLPFGNYLDTGETLRVTTSNVSDVSGNAIVPAAIEDTIVGDSVAPASATAFLDRRLSAIGLVVEVNFSDAMNVPLTTTLGAWSGSDGQAAVQVLSRNRFRFQVTFDDPIAADDTVSITTPTDVSGNVGATITVDPVE